MRLRLKQQRLLELLAAGALSQNHWALKLGLAKGHWSEIVNGKHPYPSAKTRTRMAEVFGVPIEELFEVEAGAAPWADTDFRRAIAERYLIDSDIGQGGMGAVYLARDVRHGRPVAVKVISPEAVSGIGLDQFRREIATIAHLQHPNILPFHDSGEAAGHPFYVMPWIRGGSLRKRLSERVRLPLDEVVRLTQQISAALAHAHQHQVLHCDIKPENVLLDGEHPYVMDFGIARTLHSEALEWPRRGELDESAGTPAYVSPEQAAGERDLDARSDVFSLACVVFEMLTGRPPFEGTSTQAIVASRFVTPPPPIRDYAPEVPFAVQAVVERGMSVRRDQRQDGPMQFAADLAHASARASSVLAAAAVALTRVIGAVRRRMGRRAAFGIRVFDELGDIKYAFRQARRAPAFTAMTVLTFALGIGLTTATFSLVDGVLLRALPFREPDRLVALASVDSAGNLVETVSSGNWLDWRSANTTLDGAAIHFPFPFGIGTADGATRVAGQVTSGNFFEVVGSRMVAGRPFTEDDVRSDQLVVVVSEALWRRVLGADPRLSRPLRIASRDFTVVGVVAAGQEYPVGTQVWRPGRFVPDGGAMRNNVNWLALGRLKPGVTREQAKQDLDRVALDIHARIPQALYSFGVDVQPLKTFVVGDASMYLTLLMAAITFVLLIACANLATANLGRGAARAREMAVRAALGAGRGRLARQLMVEQLFLALAGGALGALGASVGVRVLLRSWGTAIPRGQEVQLDLRVLGFALAASVTAGVLAGLAPATVGSRLSLNALISSGGRTVRGGRNVPGAALVVVEIALALVLLTGAGLLIRSFRTLVARDLGFDADAVVAEASPPPVRYRDTTALISYWERAREAVRVLPGITGVGVANWVPLGIAGSTFVEIGGRDIPRSGAGYRAVGEGYFGAMGIPIVAGRDFDSRDGPSPARVGLVNRAMADSFWPGESPIGRTMRAVSQEGLSGAQAPWVTIIGVTGDVRHGGLGSAPRPEMYVHYRHVPTRTTTMTIVARGTIPSDEMISSMRKALRDVDPDIAYDIATLDAKVDSRLADRRFTMRVLTVFSGLALLLAAIGLFGVLSYAVARRTRELAVRAALGARPPDLIAVVFKGAMPIVAIGVAAGLAGATILAFAMRGLLVDVQPIDASAYGLATIVLLTATLLAVWIPARRAAKLDPIVALQME